MMLIKETKEIVTMPYGLVPVLLKVAEGVGGVKPLKHINVIMPGRAVQVIRFYTDEKRVDKVLQKFGAIDYVKFVDADGLAHRFKNMKYGFGMVLPLN